MTARTLAIAALAFFAASGAQPLRAEELTKIMSIEAATVEYKVVLPSGYNAKLAYPAILALGGGPQTMRTVDSTLERNFRAEAEKRGYIVVAPAAPSRGRRAGCRRLSQRPMTPPRSSSCS